MRKIYYFVILFYSQFFFNSCSKEKNTRDKPSLVIVLVDVSATVTGVLNNGGMSQKSFESTFNCIDRICSFDENINNQYFKGNSNINFYSVSSKMFNSPLSESISLNEVSSAELDDENKKRKVVSEKIKKSIIESSKYDFENTCLLTSISKASDVFKSKEEQFPTNEYNYTLIIISDMIEDCPSSPIGLVDLENSMAKSTLALKKLDVNLNFPNMKVKVIIPANQFNKINGNNGEYLKKFWNDAFMKMGYSDGVNFSTEL